MAEPIFDNLKNAIDNQTDLVHEIQEKLELLNPGSGGGGHGTVYSDEVITRNAQYDDPQPNVQASLDEIYSLIGDIKDVLDSIT